ncbi:MAG: hypothetical protein HY428_00145 [Candidatus Levybacteria bacterium]|nr:hypothetical protein [Candidatus Levybacteria bacterium]
MSFSFPTEPFDFILRANTLLLYALVMVYWRFSEVTTEKEKPKTKHAIALLSKTSLLKYSYRSIGVFALMQLFGVIILPI